MEAKLVAEHNLPPFLFLKNNTENYNKQGTKGKKTRVSVCPLKLRHCLKIHAIPSCNKGKRHKDSSYNSEKLHNKILVNIKLLLVNIPDLGSVFPDLFGFVTKQGHFFSNTEKSCLESSSISPFVSSAKHPHIPSI